MMIQESQVPYLAIPAGCASLFVSGESIGAKRSLSDSVLIKQLAKKSSRPPQVLKYTELPWPAW